MTAVEKVGRDSFTLAAAQSGQGAGAPVLMLSNSLGATMDMWAHQREEFGQSHRVIGYDTRGHGQSDAPAGDYSFEDLVADALAVMDHFGVETCDFIGLSLGGMTGLGVGLTAPKRLRRLLVCAARADAPAPFVQSWVDRIASVRTGGLATLWPGTLERWLSEDFRIARPDAVSQLHAGFLATAPSGYASCAAALKHLDYLRHLGSLSVPTLYVAGEHDTGAPVAAMAAMAEATPGADYVVIPGAAHIINVNAPEAFDAALRRFLQD